MNHQKTRQFVCFCGVAVLCLHTALYSDDSEMVAIQPEEYAGALRNPMKGFTNRGFTEDNEWATLVHSYIRWNQIEDHESDGIDKIKQWCDTAWEGVAERNQKVIPRVYLHWDGDKQYWPSDMTPGDYTSPQFVQRVTRLVGRLGVCWNGDPRVAHIEMGLIGKWGEHHSPAPTPEIQALLGRLFEEAFPDKQVLVRHPWREFLGHGFGGYWDSWAHADQMKSHGQGMASLGDLWQTSLIGGEAAYNWGQYRVQPGDSPTDTVSDPVHRGFLIDTIRSLHCTQLRWVGDYDQTDPVALAGAEEIQKAFGYRFVLKEIRYPRRVEPGQTFEVAFDVLNTGSAPFYYDWPVELSLLKPDTGQVVWRALFEEADIRQWMPGDQWNPRGKVYSQAAELVTVKGGFTLDSSVEQGRHVLALSVLDPAGMTPSLRFAIKNILAGGRHAMGWIGVGMRPKIALIHSKMFVDPMEDLTIQYDY